MMLSKPPISSTLLFPLLSLPKLFAMFSRPYLQRLWWRKRSLFCLPYLERQGWNLLSSTRSREQWILEQFPWWFGDAWAGMDWGILAEVEGRMDAEQYVSILEDDLLSSMEDSEIPEESFQQDIDPKHSSKRAQNWFKYQGIRLLDWPAQSPDPSPVLLSTSGNISRKELWKATKRRLEALGENSGRVGEDWGWRVSETNWEYAYKTWGSEWYKHREGIQSTKIHHIIWGQICVPMTGHFEILVPHSHGNQITWPKWWLNAKSLYFYLSCKHYAWFILALLQFSNLPKMTQHWHTFLSHCRYTDSDPNLTRGAPKWLMWNSLPKWLLITKWPANCAFNSQSQQELNRDDHLLAANKQKTFKRDPQAKHPTMPVHPTIPLSNKCWKSTHDSSANLPWRQQGCYISCGRGGSWSVYQRQPDEDIPMYAKKTPHRWKNQNPDKPQCKGLKTQVEILLWYTLQSSELSQISVWWKSGLL